MRKFLPAAMVAGFLALGTAMPAAADTLPLLPANGPINGTLPKVDAPLNLDTPLTGQQSIPFPPSLDELPLIGSISQAQSSQAPATTSSTTSAAPQQQVSQIANGATSNVVNGSALAGTTGALHAISGSGGLPLTGLIP